ncbi:unnamed protein product, partial [Cylicocyclus nassatus]
RVLLRPRRDLRPKSNAPTVLSSSSASLRLRVARYLATSNAGVFAAFFPTWATAQNIERNNANNVAGNMNDVIKTRHGFETITKKKLAFRPFSSCCGLPGPGTKMHFEMPPNERFQTYYSVFVRLVFPDLLTVLHLFSSLILCKQPYFF